MSKVYQLVIRSCDKIVPSKLRPLWQHPAGPKTIFFWAPAFKWMLVAASFDELRRPVETLSPSTAAGLSLTGFIWTRYCLVIKPKNYALCICNLFLGMVNGLQTLRAVNYQWQQKKLTVQKFN